jgi:hypothetical protein
MGLLADILLTPRTNLIPSILQFPSMDIDGVKKRLRIAQRACEQGKANLPAADSEVFDHVEREIVADIENICREQFNHYLEQQKTYVERAADTAVHGQVLKIRSIASGSVANFQRETHVGTGDLYACKRAVIQTEAEFNNFRKRHNLERPPRDYESKAFKLWFLVLLLAIEAVLNGFFLAKGSEFGLVGGVVQAMIIAGLNISVGVAVGRFAAPWLSYRSWTTKVLAAVAILVYLGLAFGFNLAVAHYRTAMTGDPFDASVNAYRDLRAHAFGIEDLESWGLFVMGLMFSLFAAYDGWRLDDPYPGYGQRMRQNLEALQKYNDLKHDLLIDLDEIKKKAEDETQDLMRSITSRQGELGNIVMRSEALKAAIAEHFDHLESSVNTLLAFYRNENQKCRTAPAPHRFNDSRKWEYQRPTLEGARVSEDGRKGIEEALKQAMSEIPRQQEILNDAYKRALDEYKQIDELVKIEDASFPKTQL